MSSAIEERIVSMVFDNRKFQSGVSDSIGSINSLKKSLDMQGAAKGLESVGDAANKVKFDGMSSGLEAVKVKFSALQVAAITCLTNITNSAFEAGKNLISSLTIDPIKQGFEEYETQMNAIQTILANTSSKGTTLDQVKGALSELNTYSDKTIYNFTEMTKNIGTFTAAGVDLQTSTKAIKGIANLAAVSGSNSQQASTAMYQLSQALASGRVTLQDWNSVVNAGMGGAVFQDSLRETAKVMGKNVNAAQSFRESIDGQSGTGWLTSDVLLKTLEKFTGDMSAADLAAQGYNETQIEGILKMGVTANDAATKVKTFTQLLDTLKEAVGSGWAQTWQTIFGDFEEAKVMFTDVSNTLGIMIGQSSKARNDMLTGWKDLGGRTMLIDAIKSAFDDVMIVVKALGGAFRDIFPATTSQDLMNFTTGLKTLMDNLKLSDTNAANLRSTFKGLFAVVDIVKQVFVGLVGGISTILTGSDKLGSSLLALTGSFGEWLTALDNSIKSSGIINSVIQSLAQNIRNAFNGTGNTLEYFGKKFTEIRDAVIKEIKFDPWVTFGNVLSNIGKTVGLICDKVSELQGKLSDLLSSFGQKFNGIDVGGAVKSVYESLASLLTGQTDQVEKANDKMQSTFLTDMGNFMKNIGYAAAAAIGFGVTKIMLTLSEVIRKKGNVGSIFDGLKEAISNGFGSITGTLDGVRDCLKAYQAQLKADILIKIAIAIGILAASIAVIAMIDSGKLATSLAAIGGLFAQLLIATKVFSLIGEFKASAIKSSIVMIAMATSILILANAMKKLGELNVTQTITSLGSVIVLMGVMAGVVKILSKDSGTFVKGAIGIIAFAEAINILADACIKLSKLDLNQLGKGLLGVGTLLAELALFMKLGNPSLGLKTAASILVLSFALNNMYKAVSNIGNLDWEVIKKGLMGLGGVLLEVAAFDKLTINTKNVIANSVALGIISVAMNNMVPVLTNIGNLDWEVIKKGLIGMGGALLEVAIFDKLTMNTKSVIANSIALGIISVAMNNIVPVLTNIGNLDWEVIKKGLIGMGGALTEIALFNRFESGMTGTIKAAVGLGIAVSALSVLAKALEMFGNLSWEQITKGLVGMGGALLEIVLMMSMLSSNAPINGLALIEICTALNILTKAFIGFSGLSWEGIVKGIVATAAALAAIAIAMKLIPADSIFTALGLTGVASALVLMSKAMVTLSGLTWEGVAKGIVAIGGALLVLVGGIKLMQGSLSGVAALILAAVALNLLVDPILKLSTISWEGLLISLVALAGTIATLGIAAAVLSPVIPAMYGLAGALVLLGLAIVGIGAGIALATYGLQQLSQSFTTLDGTTEQGAANIASSMTAMVQGIANGIPDLITKIGEGITIILQYLIDAIPKFVDFVLQTIIAVATSIAENMPKILDTVFQILNSILDALIKWTPTIVGKVADILIALLTGLADSIERFVKVGIDIIVGFIKGITDSLPKVIDTAFKLIITFINGLADAIRANSGPLGEACGNLVTAIIDGIASFAYKFTEAGVNCVKGFVGGISKSIGDAAAAGKQLGRMALDAAKKALDEHSPSKEMDQVGVFAGQGLVNGLVRMGSKVYNAGYNIGNSALDSMSKAMDGISNIVNTDLDSDPIITPVMDLSEIQNGSKQIFGMMDNLNGYNINGSVGSVNSTARSVRGNTSGDEQSPDNIKSNSVNNPITPRQPANIQLVLGDGRVIAQYLVDDMDDLLGSKNKITGRMVGV